MTWDMRSAFPSGALSITTCSRAIFATPRIESATFILTSRTRLISPGSSGDIYYSDTQIDKDNRRWADRWIENEILKDPTWANAGRRELRRKWRWPWSTGASAVDPRPGKSAAIGPARPISCRSLGCGPRARNSSSGSSRQGYPPQEPAGIARYTHALAEGLADRGHEVHVFTRHEETPETSFEGNVWVHRSPDADEPWLQAIEEGRRSDGPAGGWRRSTRTS